MSQSHHFRAYMVRKDADGQVTARVETITLDDAAAGRRADPRRLFVAQLQGRAGDARAIRASSARFRTCRASIARARWWKARRPTIGRATKCSSPATNWAPAIGADSPRSCACRPSGSCRCPAACTLRDAMIYGTAGFTAAQCVTAIVERGIEPDRGPVVVTGATGGVGSLAVAILAKLGYEVEAVTGKTRAARLAATARRADRFSVATTYSTTAIGRCCPARWAAAVDTVGGQPLATILRSTATSRLRRRLRPGGRRRTAAQPSTRSFSAA